MKLRNILTFIFLSLGTTNILAEWDAIQCGPTTTPVLTNAGWQCQPAGEGDPRTVYPGERASDGQFYPEPEYAKTEYYDGIRRGPFIASEVSECSN